MKTPYIGLIITLIAALSGCEPITKPENRPDLANLTYDKARPLYDNTRSSFRTEDLQGLLDRANASNLPVVFYLHGRGDEPEKSFNSKMTGGGALPRLELEYDVRVILINWDSKAKGNDRSEPLSHVEEGADTLRNILSQLAKYENNNPSKPKPSLLVHSMGSIVLARTVENVGWPAEKNHPLFKNILISEPDADSQGHATWLSNIADVERVYVTQNSKDSVLTKSTDSRTPPSNFALGLRPAAPLAKNARYIDLTDALRVKRIAGLVPIGAHQIFSKSWMGDNVNTCQFVTKVLHGETFEPTEIAGISRLSPGRYKAAAKPNKDDACFNDDGE